MAKDAEEMKNFSQTWWRCTWDWWVVSYSASDWG